MWVFLVVQSGWKLSGPNTVGLPLSLPGDLCPTSHIIQYQSPYINTIIKGKSSHPHQIPRKTINMAHTNSRLEIWCVLKNNADARESLWPRLIGQFNILLVWKSRFYSSEKHLLPVRLFFHVPSCEIFAMQDQLLQCLL